MSVVNTRLEFRKIRAVLHEKHGKCHSHESQVFGADSLFCTCRIEKNLLVLCTVLSTLCGRYNYWYWYALGRPISETEGMSP